MDPVLHEGGGGEAPSDNAMAGTQVSVAMLCVPFAPEG